MANKKEKTDFFIIFKEAAITAVITAAICCLLLFATGLIPQSAIKESCIKSAEYFKDKELFDDIMPNRLNTRRDNYGDILLLNTMYHISGQNPVRSLIQSFYYNPENESVNISFYDSVMEDKEPNVNWSRYWQGATVLVRPLFVWVGIEQARLIIGWMVLALMISCVALLWRLGSKSAAVSYLLGNGIVQVWMCLFCIEYAMTFLVANVILLAVLCLFLKKESEDRIRKRSLLLMAVSGVVTCFVDLLTTETLTVTIPLLFLMILLYEQGKLRGIKEEIRYLTGCGISWCLSYVGMFLFKWLLAAMVLGTDAFTTALGAAGKRLGGAVITGYAGADEAVNFGERVIGILYRNQGSLFPFKEKMTMGASLWLFFGVCFLCFAIVYLFRPKNLPFNIIVTCLLLGAVPYVRYLVLQNHAYIHYFFTYRAQMVTVVAILYCTWQFGLKGIIIRKK
ncbi:MAG: hypothetical protein J6J79_00925 [Lachnospiraceae bacterium]|nr:hypothetical protein [Lachnospiraceae bacterium]